MPFAHFSFIHPSQSISHLDSKDQKTVTLCERRSEIWSSSEPDGDGGAQRVPDHVASSAGARAPRAVLHHQVPHGRAVEDPQPRTDTTRGDQLLG